MRDIYMEFLDVKTDFAFKKVFGSEQSKEILISFLNSIIDFSDGSKIEDLTIVDPYQIPLLKGMKDTYVDVKAVLSNQARVIIEMQVLNFEGFEKRVLYNAAKTYSTQLKKAESYPKLEPVIALTITDFVMFREIDKIITYFKLREKETLIEYSDDIELIFAELPKFTKSESELKTITDKWLYFIKNAGSLEYIPKTITDKEIREAFDIANTASLTEEEYELQFKRKDFIYIQKSSIEKAEKEAKEAIEKAEKEAKEAIEKGRKEERIEIAKKSLKQGLNCKIISLITGLSKEEIERLKQ